MTTFFTVEWVAIDEYGNKIVDLLPIEEIPDRPPWYYKVLKPFTYRRTIKERKDSVTVVMEKLFDIYTENEYTKLTAKLKWDVL